MIVFIKGPDFSSEFVNLANVSYYYRYRWSMTYEKVPSPPTTYIRSSFEIAVGPSLAALRFPASVHWSKIYFAIRVLSSPSQRPPNMKTDDVRLTTAYR